MGLRRRVAAQGLGEGEQRERERLKAAAAGPSRFRIEGESLGCYLYINATIANCTLK